MLLIVTAPPLVFLLLWGMGGFLVSGDPIHKSDAVVLLSGGDDARLAEAAQIYRSGQADILLLTETGTIPEGGGPRASTLSGRQAAALGVAQDAIRTTLGKSASTRDEASAVLDYCQLEGLRDVIVVKPTLTIPAGHSSCSGQYLLIAVLQCWSVRCAVIGTNPRPGFSASAAGRPHLRNMPS